MTQSAFSTGRETTRGDVRAWIAMAAILIGVCSTATPAYAQCQYEVTAIITPDDENACFPLPPSPTFGQGMNIHADVVGYYWPCALGNDEAFFWSEETGFVTLPKPPGVSRAWAYDISDTRLIVGQHAISGVGRKGFVYDMNKNDGQFMYLEPLHDGVTGQNVSSANAVNSSGLVAGSRSISKPGEPNVYNAVIWDTNTGEVIDLGVVNGPNSAALDIDEAGQIAVGWDGFSPPTTTGQVWHGDQVIDLGPIPRGDSSHVLSMNENGYISGTGWAFDPQQNIILGFIWKDDEFTIIEPPPPFERTSAGNLNDHNQALVLCSIPGGFQRPFLWQHAQMVDLNTLVADTVTLTQPSAMNNTGQLLVRASTKAVLLTPIDVPFGDLNYDCNVDVYDLLIMLEQWGPVARGPATGGGAGTPIADLNGDGVVNVLDLLILLEHWTF